MESDLGYAVFSIGDDEDTATKPANPRLQPYFVALYALAKIFSFLLMLRRAMHPHNAYGSFLMIIAIASSSLALLMSLILVLTSYYMPTYMRDGHYTVLKTIGSFSAVLAPFCLLVLLFVPDKPNLVTFSVISLFVVGFLVACVLFWKHVVHQNDQWSEPTLHPRDFALFLIPLLIALSSFISRENPPLINYALLFLCLTILAAFFLAKPWRMGAQPRP